MTLKYHLSYSMHFPLHVCSGPFAGYTVLHIKTNFNSQFNRHGFINMYVPVSPWQYFFSCSPLCLLEFPIQYMKFKGFKKWKRKMCNSLWCMMLHAFCPSIFRYHYIVLLCCTMFIFVGVPKYYRYTLYIIVFTFWCLYFSLFYFILFYCFWS